VDFDHAKYLIVTSKQVSLPQYVFGCMLQQIYLYYIRKQQDATLAV